MAQTPLTSDDVKQMARDLGADLVGVASADVMNAFPPDPLWPQTPEAITPRCRSVKKEFARVNHCATEGPIFATRNW